MDAIVVMDFYHGTDSSSKHCKVHLHNLSIRSKASGLHHASGKSIHAAGIDKVLNGGLTPYANAGVIFHSSSITLLHICFKDASHSYEWLGFSAEHSGH